MGVRQEGLKQKYIITKVDGSEVDPKAKYFVLRYDANMKDKDFLRAARNGLFTFVNSVEKSFPELAKELRADVSDEIRKEFF